MEEQDTHHHNLQNQQQNDHNLNDQYSDAENTTQSLIEEISTKSFRASSPTSIYHQALLNQHNNYGIGGSSSGSSNTSRRNQNNNSASTPTASNSVSTHQFTSQQEKNNMSSHISKHFNIQCYRGLMIEESNSHMKQQQQPQELVHHPKSITIEWVFDDCITQRFIHKMLRKSLGSKHFSDVEFRFSNENSDSEDSSEVHSISSSRSTSTTLTISENACFLIPSIACKIDEGKIQTIELQIPFCFHFAIDYPEDIPSILTIYNQKVTMEGCVVFSSQVFVQIFEWCEHYANNKEFIQIDLEGKGMMFCCNSESYFKSVIGEWNWDFLQSMDRNVLLQTLIMSHILSITPLLLMIKTKIMFDVRQKCKEAANNQPSHASTK